MNVFAHAPGQSLVFVDRSGPAQYLYAHAGTQRNSCWQEWLVSIGVGCRLVIFTNRSFLASARGVT